MSIRAEEAGGVYEQGKALPYIQLEEEVPKQLWSSYAVFIVWMINCTLTLLTPSWVSNLVFYKDEPNPRVSMVNLQPQEEEKQRGFVVRGPDFMR